MAQPDPSKSACQCGGIGWVCAGTGKPADFEKGTCCEPGWSEYGYLGPGCPSADGCPDCGGGVESVATTKSAPRRANDRGHGIRSVVQMQAERTALITQVVKAVEALKPNEAIFLPGETIAARSEAGTLRFGRGWFQPRWYRVDGLQGAREYAESLLTGNPMYVSRDRSELVFSLKEGACPVANVGRRNFYVVRPTND